MNSLRLSAGFSLFALWLASIVVVLALGYLSLRWRPDAKRRLVSQAEAGIVGGADLYITVDERLLKRTKSAGIVAEPFAIAVHTPVIAVVARRALELTSLRDDGGARGDSVRDRIESGCHRSSFTKDRQSRWVPG